MKKLILAFIALILLILGYIYFDYSTRIDVNVNKKTVEINTSHLVSEFIISVKNASLENYNENITFNKLGENNITLKLKNKIGKIYKKDIKILVKDTVKPIITCESEIISYVNEDIQFEKYVNVDDNSNEQIIPSVYGEYDGSKSGTYNIRYEAIDSSDNKSECNSKLIIKDKLVVAKIKKNQYYIRLNKKQNVVMIYGLDTSNNYSILVKTFVISAGKNTPLGEFELKEKHDYISFAAGTNGRYATRINGSYWFHSVPYYNVPKDGHWNSILYNEFNKLGSYASLGCIRMTVIDAKWIYENVPSGTMIYIYESDELPEGVVKPIPPKIDINSPKRGWDPTDPDIANPNRND